MKTFLDNHPNDAILKTTPQWEGFFGPNANPSVVRATVRKMVTDKIKINSADPNHADAASGRSHGGVVAFTMYRLGYMGSIHLGSRFYSE
jgi:hypothetical protein